MTLYPAIDLRGGRCVRLVEGDFSQETVYGDDPLAVAERFCDEGATHLHVVDLDGAKAGEPVHLPIIERLAKTKLSIQMGGGLRTRAAVLAALNAGAARVILGSVLAKELKVASALFAEFGDRVVAGIDVRQECLAISGWQEDTTLAAIPFARNLSALGCRVAIVTDISRDGKLAGPNLGFTARFMRETSLETILSGGVGSLTDLKAAKAAGLSGLIVGKALYEHRFTVAEALTTLAS